MRRRLFGIVDDATSGGSEYDDLVSGAIPDSSIFWPVTGGTLDKNIEPINRDDEVRSRRARTAPLPFRAGPVMTVPMPAYRKLVEKILKKTLGGADTVTPGSGVTSQLHTIAALGFGSTYLPAVNAQLVRDDLNHKMSGSSFQRASFAFPLDGEGTVEVELWGLYYKHDTAAVPTADYAGYDDVFALRDATVFIDGGGTAIPDLQGFEFAWVNNLTRQWYAKRNVVAQTIGSPSLTRKVWYPAENLMGAAQDVTYAINLGNTNTAQELAHDFGQIQKFVFEVTGGPLSTTPASTELLRVTIYNGEHTAGGAEPLTARDQIPARFEGGAFYSTADSADVKIEIVNGATAPIT